MRKALRTGEAAYLIPEGVSDRLAEALGAAASGHPAQVFIVPLRPWSELTGRLPE